MEKGNRKDKNQNIQVFVRLRPLNQREKDIKSLGVIEVVGGREVVVRTSSQTFNTKRFTFDRAFPPLSKQVEVYQEVVSPLIAEVLLGYNCTVFAYGQTGTGKTHTMVGEPGSDEISWQNDPLAGIIPRALSQLFDELRLTDTEYTVRVSYLELYNEELFDLLSSSEDNSKLRIYEDNTRKGANIVNGLEEITVYNKNEVFKIMAQGQERKKVASTLMNAQSSRSHTVFTIVVHMKENSQEGEELVKIGKLNLVDLAGSENISKAGSDNPGKKERARECVNINQSLLTLGRVITALVERHPHIPYRESKLTRILQESLGGRTKTSIIATISPGHKDLEETLSTLEYANRAKNIQNKPEVNQKMTKKTIIKHYIEEIDRLKRDLYAAREKSGVYLANETYMEMTLKQEERKKEIQELLLEKKAMEEQKEKMENLFKELNFHIEEKIEKLGETKRKLSETQTLLKNTSDVLKTKEQQFEEQKYLVEKQMETEAELSSQAKKLLEVAETVTGDACKLHDSVDKRKSVETANLEITRTYREISTHHRNNITMGTDNFMGALVKILCDWQTCFESHSKESTQLQTQSKQKLDNLVHQSTEAIEKITAMKEILELHLTSTAEKHCSEFNRKLNVQYENMIQIFDKFVSSMQTCLQKAEQYDLSYKMAEFLKEWKPNTVKQVSKWSDLHWGMDEIARQCTDSVCAAARKQQHDVNEVCRNIDSEVQQKITAIEQLKKDAENHLSKQLKEIHDEQIETEDRLNSWAEQEIQRIKNHVTSERNYVKNRIDKRIENLNEQKKEFEAKMSKEVDWLKVWLETRKSEIEKVFGNMQDTIENINIKFNDWNNLTENFKETNMCLNMTLEQLDEAALKVVEQVKVDLVNNLHSTQAEIVTASSCLSDQSKQETSELVADSNKMVQSLIGDCQRTLDSIVGVTCETSKSTIEDLALLSNTTSSLMSSSQNYANTQNQTLLKLQSQSEQFHCGMREEVSRLEELETRCLNQEYARYCPSGNTPVRADYKYPRKLAATSPHERILERFRATRQTVHDDDCMIVENESECRSDTDSSTSEDATLLSITMPPTTPLVKPSPIGIVKCTSETDIITFRRRQRDQEEREKENSTQKNGMFKKPSKLPAPTSHHKPLAPRNDDNKININNT